MSDEHEELELKALERQLEDAFETTRPRRGFDDELWLRLQQRRPFWARVRDALGGIPGSVRGLAVPTAAVATVLVVAIVVGAVAVNNGFHVGGHSFAASAPNANPAAGPADLANGPLPTPMLHPGLFDSGIPGAVAPGPEGLASSPELSGSNLYFGPAKLAWTGSFYAASVQAPVFAYDEPSLAQADRFAASIGASSSKQVRQVNGFLGTYAGQDFTVSVRGTVPQLPREPYFLLTPSAPVEGDILARYSLVPNWTYLVVQKGSASVLQRYIALPSGGNAVFVNWIGDADGIEADTEGGKVVRVFGQLPLTLTPTTYPLISNDAAVAAALSASPSGTSVIDPEPTVDLDHVQLVYALAVSGTRHYFEPAYLFSGLFSYNGQTYVKRVLVPLVDPSLRSS